MTNLKIIIPIIIVFILIVAGLAYVYQTQIQYNSQSSLSQESPRNNFPQASSSASPQKTPTGQVQSKSTASNLPATGSEDFQNLQTLIKITSPAEFSQISSPAKVEGIANVTSQQVFIEIKDANGNILGIGRASACLDYKPCPFSTTISFNQPQTQNGVIEVWSPSTTDNTQQDKVIYNITF